MTKKRIAILGSTGSIGRQTLDVVSRHPERFEIVALAAGGNVELLAEQVRCFRPRVVSARDEACVTELQVRLDALGVRIHGSIFGKDRDVERFAHGAVGLMAVATEAGADLVVAATDGAVSFDAVFAAVDRGTDIAVANKELVVAAGELLVAHAARSGAKLLPVDSEHSAIFQCLQGAPRERVAAIVLTASGGPFWERTREEMADVTVADALAHPTWSMGVKNTIDSATLMNKGLEVIEASRLFGLPAERIHVAVHRTSVAHGFVVFTDGNVVGQLAAPDMRLPIGYALAYPDRLDDGRRCDDPIEALGGERGAPATTLAFQRPDLDRFPCLRLAYQALERGGTLPAIISAANEIAVAAFVAGELRFGEISACIETALERVGSHDVSLEAVRDADRTARKVAQAFVEERAARSVRRP